MSDQRAGGIEEDTMGTAYEIAASRLMTVIDKPTCEERRIYAEWVLDGILDALREAFAAADA